MAAGKFLFQDSVTLFGQFREQAVEGLDKLQNAVLLKLEGCSIKIESQLLKLSQGQLRFGEAAFQGGCRMAVVAKSVHGFDRYSVDGIGSDQLVIDVLQ